jgi:cobalt/nickel transport system permease protein
MGAVMLPVWGIAVRKVKDEVTEKKMPALGVSAAFTFLVMMFNVPVPGGTTAHAICATLIAILFGPFAAILSVSTALLVQALMFGDGGILAFGANCFNMAFVMPLTGWLIYNGLKSLSKNENFLPVIAFFSAYISILLAALCNSIELGLQPLLFRDGNGNPMYCPYGWNITIPAMLVSHLIAGIADGAVTSAVFVFIRRMYPDLMWKGEMANEAAVKRRNPVLVYIILFIIAVITPLGLIASGEAFGEWDPGKLPGMNGVIPLGMKNGFDYKAPLDNYGSSVSLLNSKGLPHPFASGDSLDPNVVAGYIISAIAGAAILLILYKAVQEIARRSELKSAAR